MSLPQPLDIYLGARKIVKEVLFFFVMLLVILPAFQWVLIIGGVVLFVLKHWIIGTILILAGMAGRVLHRDLRI